MMVFVPLPAINLDAVEVDSYGGDDRHCPKKAGHATDPSAKRQFLGLSEIYLGIFVD
jgi:hypothetical protein